MNLETRYRELDAAQKIKVCARLFQNAETVLGIGKAMTESEKAAKAEQIKMLAKLLDGFGWLKMKAFVNLAENAALTAQIAHVTPALIINYVKNNESRLREMCKDEPLPLPEPVSVPPQKTDAERIEELKRIIGNPQTHDEMLLEVLISQVYFPIFERAGLVDQKKFSELLEREIAANKFRFRADAYDIRFAGAFAKFLKGIDGGIYMSDAVRRARYKIVKEYFDNKKNDSSNEKLGGNQ